MKAAHQVLLKYFVIKVFYLVVLFNYSICQAGSYDDFFIAVKRDNGAAISDLLRRGFDANTTNLDGEHGLFLALRDSSLKVAPVLLDWPGIQVETRTKKDESPLMLASLKGWTDICQKLIAQGADVNKPGWAPLHYAATNGHVDVMNLLLENHAYIDAASPNGTTPLMMAAHYGTAAAVKLLLEAGADPSLKNMQGLSAIDFAQRAKRQDSVDVIASFIRSGQRKKAW